MEELRAVERFKALGDPVRWSIVRRLCASPTSARLLAEAVRISPTLLSHHLKVLRQAGLIIGSRRGRWIDYSVEPKAFLDLGDLLRDMGLEAPSTERSDLLN